MKFTKTPRLFRRGEFKDANGEACLLQESSAIRDEALCWLGVDGNRMHLTQSQVAELLPGLHHFAEHGTLPEPE